MKKNLLLLLGLLAATATFSHEADAGESCKDVKECIELASKLTNKKYIFQKDLQGGFESTENVEWNKDNVDTLLPIVLNQFNMARVQVSEDQYLLINDRDVRYHSFPIYKVKTNDVLDLPKTFDYYTLVVSLKNPEVAPSISRSLRPFMWRYGRIIENTLSGELVLMSTGANINNMFEYIKKFDQKPSKEALKKFERNLKNDQTNQHKNKEKTHDHKNTHKKGD